MAPRSVAMVIRRMREQCVPGPLLSFVGPGNEAISECVYVCVAGGLCVRQSTVEGLTQDYIAHRCESECNLGASMTLSIFLLSPSGLVV